MWKRVPVLLALALYLGAGWAGGCVLAASGNMLNLANPGLENVGRGWRIWSTGNGRGRWPGDAHGGTAAALIETSNACQRCILVSPGVPGLQSGMRLRVSFFAKWLSGDSTVFIGFHEYAGDVANMRREWPERWRGQIPKGGAWHLMQADVEVPVFAADTQSMLKVRIGLPYARQAHWRKSFAGFEESRYLLDDISIEALSGPVFAPARSAVAKAVKHSFDKADPRDDPSRFGVFWTPWRTYCRVPLKTPREFDRPSQEMDEELDAMRDAGVRWIRSIWRWDKIEWEAGKPDYAFLDDVVERAWKRGIRFVPCLNTTPRWASTAPADDPDFRCYPPELTAWSNFVFQTVSHFKGRIKYWETWNEPNHVYWSGTVDEFCRHHQTAYRAAKAADPQCQILLGAFAGSGAVFLDQLLSMGVKDYFDVVSFHPYSGQKESIDPAERMTAHVLRVLSEYGCEDRPVWFTEIGWPGDLAPGIGAARQAELLTLLYGHAFPACVEKVFWFPFDTWGKRPPKPGKGGSGLAGVYDGKVVLTPAFEAYRKTAEKAGSLLKKGGDGGDE
ncbi:MAG TPA: beta-galactosidase [Kiritimatiellia bacterium]|nr:beta-galactosidase [Kiritimatiellia bacterium]HPS07969.1 beta-galactosidase [Kiritimatiellia bacterium]